MDIRSIDTVFGTLVLGNTALLLALRVTIPSLSNLSLLILLIPASAIPFLEWVVLGILRGSISYRLRAWIWLSVSWAVTLMAAVVYGPLAGEFSLLTLLSGFLAQATVAILVFTLSGRMAKFFRTRFISNAAGRRDEQTLDDPRWWETAVMGSAVFTYSLFLVSLPLSNITVPDLAPIYIVSILGIVSGVFIEALDYWVYRQRI